MKNKNTSKNVWLIKILIISFCISVIFSFISEVAIPNVNLFFGIILTLIFIFIGVIFDMLGLAVASGDIKVFNSMASKKIKGAKMALKLIKNRDKVSSFCNDVVGDICGIISGSTGAVISLKIITITNFNPIFVTVIVMGIISSLTIAGKALEKTIAIKRSTDIIYVFAKIISVFKKD